MRGDVPTDRSAVRRRCENLHAETVPGLNSCRPRLLRLPDFAGRPALHVALPAAWTVLAGDVVNCSTPEIAGAPDRAALRVRVDQTGKSCQRRPITATSTESTEVIATSEAPTKTSTEITAGKIPPWRWPLIKRRQVRPAGDRRNRCRPAPAYWCPVASAAAPAGAKLQPAAALRIHRRRARTATGQAAARPLSSA